MNVQTQVAASGAAMLWTLPAEPNLATLVRVLDEGKAGPNWPAGFDWDYSHSSSCGIGLAKALWERMQMQHPLGVGPLFGLTFEQAWESFFTLHDVIDCEITEVTPADVAAALRAQVPA